MIVLDSLGIGALPDAAEYDDVGADTLGHILQAVPDTRLPNLTKMGLLKAWTLGREQKDGARIVLDAQIADGTSVICDAQITDGTPADCDAQIADGSHAARDAQIADGAQAARDTQMAHDQDVPIVCGAYGKMAESSKGKDTITGHWEIAGLVTDTPFQTFERFPDDFMRDFEAAIGRETLGNYAASGTVIIEDLGAEHERTGKPIIYTSHDSVFQIAANTAVISLDELYRICAIARTMLQGAMLVGRVIARPYVMQDGKRIRTSDRHDYAVPPPEKTLLDRISDAGQDVVAVGKIKDIFAGQGITAHRHSEDNADGIEQTIQLMNQPGRGLVFTNLVDFDAKYGHRRDVAGYANALEQFDLALPRLMTVLKEREMIVLCADHGNDPCYEGYNHTREYVPVLIYGKHIIENSAIGIRSSFADLGATIAEALGVPQATAGRSFLKEIVCGD